MTRRHRGRGRGGVVREGLGEGRAGKELKRGQRWWLHGVMRRRGEEVVAGQRGVCRWGRGQRGRLSRSRLSSLTVTEPDHGPRRVEGEFLALGLGLSSRQGRSSPVQRSQGRVREHDTGPKRGRQKVNVSTSVRRYVSTSVRQ